MKSNVESLKRHRWVIHIITTLEPGGSEKQLLELCRKQSSRNRLFVIFLKGKGTLSSSFEDLNVKVMRFGITSFVFLCKTVFNERQGKLKPDSPIIHAHLPRAEIIASLLSKLLRVRLIVSKHNCERFWPKGPRLFSKMLARWVGSTSSTTICISNAVLNYLTNIGEINVEDDVRVVYYGLDLNNLVPVTKSIARDNIFLIGTLSRLESQKNLEVLIEAIHVLKSMKVEAKARIYGKGSKEEALRLLIRNRELLDCVEIHNPVQDLASFWREIDIFVLTSTYEGFGLATLEAIWQGKPVLISSSDASRELMNNSPLNLFRVGSHEDLAQKILELVKSPKKRFRNQLAAQERAKFFSIECTAKQIEQIYEKI